MNTNRRNLSYRVRPTFLMGVLVYLLGAGVASTTAYTPNANRDVSYDFLTVADTSARILAAPSPASELEALHTCPELVLILGFLGESRDDDESSISEFKFRPLTY